MRKFFKDHQDYSYDPTTGEVFGKNGRVLKPALAHAGYLQVALHENGKQKTYTVHRLIAEAEIPNPENKPTVNHINEIKTDNRACNLEWATYKENNNYGVHNTKVSESNKGNKNALGNKSMLGKHHSDEAKKKISNALKGKPLSEEHRRKISEVQKGKHLSENTKRKLSEINKGKTLSEEHRKKISEGNKGKHYKKKIGEIENEQDSCSV